MTTAIDHSDDGLVHMTFLGGHRGDYQELFAALFKLKPSVGKVSRKNLKALIRPPKLLFGSLDDDIFGFCTVALFRSILGRNTAGLFLRPQSCFLRGDLRAVVKRTLFGGLKYVPGVSIFTIVPFEVAPHYRSIASVGLADPQLWDKTVIPVRPCAKFRENLQAISADRKVIAFVGSVGAHKGIAQLRDLMKSRQWEPDRCSVVVAGRVAEDCREIVAEVQELGGTVFERFVSNEELAALYEVADFVWAGYSPEYDQASGIFGRAIQEGKVPFVRRGSLIEQLAAYLDYPVVSIDFIESDATSFEPSLYANSPPKTPKAILELWRDQFLREVRLAL